MSHCKMMRKISRTTQGTNKSKPDTLTFNLSQNHTRFGIFTTWQGMNIDSIDVTNCYTVMLNKFLTVYFHATKIIYDSDDITILPHHVTFIITPS